MTHQVAVYETVCAEYEPTYAERAVISPGWTGGARSVDRLDGDGYFSFSVERYSTGVVIGLAPQNDTTEPSEQTHAIYFTYGSANIYESGIAVGSGWSSSSSDIYHIVRIGHEVIYCREQTNQTQLFYYGELALPGEPLYTSTVPSDLPVFLDASLFMEGDRILSASLTSGVTRQVQEARGDFTLTGVAQGYKDRGADGQFRISGIASDHQAQAVGGFGLSGEAVYTFARGDGQFQLTGEVGTSRATIAKGGFGLQGMFLGDSRNEAKGGFSISGGATTGPPLQPMNWGYAYGGFQLNGDADMEEYTPRGARGRLWFVGRAMDTPRTVAEGGFRLRKQLAVTTKVPQNYIIGTLPRFADNGLMSLRETARFGTPVATYEVHVSLSSTESLVLDTSVKATGTLINELTTTLQFGTNTVAALVQPVADQIALSNPDVAVTIDKLLQANERLNFATGTSTSLRATLILASELALQDVVTAGKLDSVQDTLVLADAISSYIQILMQALDTIDFADSLQGTVYVALSAQDPLSFGDESSTTGTLIEALTTGLELTLRGGFNERVMSVWAVNTETGAASEYKNFSFRSFCKVGAYYLGASETGLYTLTHDSDDGSPISAWLRTGLTDFDVPDLKRIESLYLGYTADDKLVLKVTATRHGEAETRWYQLTPRAKTEPQGGRIKTAKGVASRYWEFELHNTGGGEFELDTIELIPLVLRRKT